MKSDKIIDQVELHNIPTQNYQNDNVKSKRYKYVQRETSKGS